MSPIEGDELSDLGEVVPYVHFHRDGSVRARGQNLNGEPHGYWEWFRLDGTIMRSGTFEAGAQMADWITYDRNGSPYKTTRIKPI